MNTPGPRIDVVADLVVDVDGSPVTITADGAEVLVALADPVAVLDAAAGLPRVAGPGGNRRAVLRGLAGLADRAAAAGLDVVVTGPSGVLASVGPHARAPRAVRWLAGTDRVALGSWTTWRGPLLGLLRRRTGRWVGRVRPMVKSRRSR